MSPATPRASVGLTTDARVDPEHEDEHPVSVLELFFDLVFVLAITQVTLLLAEDLTLGGMLRGLLILALLWWSWVGYSWLTNSIDLDDVATRISIFVAMAAFTVAALAVPAAYGDDALPFALAYAVVRAMQVGLYAYGTDDDDPNHGAILKLGPGFLISAGLIVLGAGVGGEAQPWIWLVAIMIDVLTPLVVGNSQFRVHAGHFAERHGLIIIIALGESIVVLGSGVTEETVDVSRAIGASLGVAAAATLWWLYFDIVAIVAEHRMKQARGAERSRIARDSYSYIHFFMIAGIVLLALGTKKSLLDSEEPLKLVPAIALCAGPALYLLGHIAFRLRNVGTVNRQRLVAAIALVALIPVAHAIDALPALALVTAVLVALVTYEHVRFAEQRAAIMARITENS
ncbi:MAG TPA: low temperature requirement protein A [Solirubrobacteraceae bacterium]|nr:low temperature requirement protein A [Solirubrobacteraceae bacterium]